MKKMSSGDLLFAICAWTFLILFCLITLYPFFRMIALSFSGSIDAYTSDGPYLIPRHPTLENYVQVLFKRESIRNGAITTVAIATERIHGGSLDQNTPTPSTLSAALAVVSMVPILILYPFLQKYFETGLKIRGLKK